MYAFLLDIERVSTEMHKAKQLKKLPETLTTLTGVWFPIIFSVSSPQAAPLETINTGREKMTQKSGGMVKGRREAKSFFLTIWLWVRSLRSTPFNVKNSFVYELIFWMVCNNFYYVCAVNINMNVSVTLNIIQVTSGQVTIWLFCVSVLQKDCRLLAVHIFHSANHLLNQFD